jgi:outer membrane protein assembly factor BamB
MIFLTGEDAFFVDESVGQWRSLREAARERLREAGPAVQQAWNRTAMASSEGAWEAAVSRGDLAGAAAIAAGWPLSELDLRLQLLRLLEAWHAGEGAAAERAAAEVLRTYSGTALASRAEALMQPFRRSLQAEAVRSSSGFETTGGAVLSTVSVGPSAAAAPWPRPIWRWREVVQQQIAECQQAESSLLLSQDPRTAAAMRVVQFWRPLLWGPWVICRTPSRLVALDRLSGAECWQLPTDPGLRDASDGHDVESTEPFPFDSAVARGRWLVDIRRDTRWGILAADEECLWLIDRFPVFSGLSDMIDGGGFGGGLPRLNPWLPDELQPAPGGIANRLICLRRERPLGDDPRVLPEVAWGVGEGAGNYRVLGASEPANPEEPESREQREQLTDGFSGRQFCSGPAVSGDRLVVLSESDETELLEVNCIHRKTGQLIWRQPLLQATAFRDLQQAYGGGCQSVCLICGDVVICSLEGTIIAAVNLWDGGCRWMQPLAPLQSAGMLLGDMPWPRSLFLPVASEKLVICSAPDSTELHAVEAATGRRLWTVPRQSGGEQGPGGSADLLIAGLFEEQLILVGERHCRSLDPLTGIQRWLVETGPCSGMPLCNGNRCVLPQLDGRPLVIDLRIGQRVEQSELFLPGGTESVLGAFAGDEDMIFSGTSGVITAWRRADAAVASGLASAATRPGPYEQLQALLLNGDLTAAATYFREGDVFEAALRPRASELLAEAWLLQRTASEVSAASSAAIPDWVQLNPVQQVRLAMFSNSLPATAPAGVGEQTLLRMDARWDASLSALRSTLRPQELTPETISSLPLPELRLLAESACQHPNAAGGPVWLRGMISELSKRGLSESAELLAAAWWQEAACGEGPEDAVQAAEAARTLRALRFQRPDIVSVRGLQSSTVRELRASAELTLYATEAHAADPEGVDLPEAAPWWLQQDLRLTVASGTGRHLLLLDRGPGGVLERLPGELGWRAPVVNFRQTSRLLSAPGLVPVQDGDRLLMTGIGSDGRMRVLWSRSISAADSSPFDPEPGPLWPGGFIWHASDTLFCLHPLSGRVLWKRRLPQTRAANPLLSSRIFGDHEAILVMGADGASFERFRARDGRLLGRSFLQIGRGTECGVVGRFLIHTDLNYRLRVFDGASGEELLADEPAVILARTQTEQLFAALPGNRILTVTDTGELVLIDLLRGCQVYRTQLPPQESLAAVSGIRAVEIQGQLLVVLENIGAGLGGGFGAAANGGFQLQGRIGMFGMGISEELRKLPRGAALRIDDGILCALDADTGKLQWIQPRYDCALHHIGGDATDLLVLSESRHSQSPTADGGLAEHLNVEVLNPGTGATLLRAGPIFISEIHAAWHDAKTAEIRLTATDGEVVLREGAE